MKHRFDPSQPEPSANELPLNSDPMSTSQRDSSAAASGHPAHRPRRRGRLRRALNWLMMLALVGAVLTVQARVSLWRASAALEERRHPAAERWLIAAKLSTWLPWMKADRGEIHYHQARLLRRFGILERVGPELKRAQELGWDAALLEREQAFALAQDGQFQKLGSRWGRLFVESGSDAPELAEAYVIWCLSRFRLAEAQQALTFWEADFPEDHRPHRYRGQIAFVLQEWDSAIAELQKALTLSADDVETRLLKAKAHLKLLQFDAAEAELRTLLLYASDRGDARALLAHCLSHRNRPEEARSTLERILRDQPGHFDALREAGLLELKLGRHADAAGFLEQAAEIHPEDAELRQALAKALAGCGRTEEAESHFQFMEQASPALLRLPRQTTELAQQPDNVALRFEIAETVWMYRSRAEGLLWLKSLLEFDPRHAGAHQLLAEHYRLTGDEQRAAEHQQQAASIGRTQP